MLLSEMGWPEGYDRLVLDEVDSTLDEARRRADAGPCWIMAHRQSAARGRRGRAWQMPVGNFAATLVMQPEGAPGQAALRSFVAALAVLETCISVTGRAQGFAVKWPNDVLLNGGKLAGILLESTGQGVGLQHLAVGIGVNLVAAPGADQVEEGALRPVSLFSETGLSVAAEEFLDVLAAHFALLENQFTAYGFAPIRTAWLSHAAKRGQVITARTTHDSFTGTFADVDTDGQLVLDTVKERVTLPAADVYF